MKSFKCLRSEQYYNFNYFQNDEDWCFLFCSFFYRSRDTQVFFLTINDVTLIISQMTVMNHKIENISKNIGIMIFNLGTSNVHQMRHKVTSIKILP